MAGIFGTKRARWGTLVGLAGGWSATETAKNDRISPRRHCLSRPVRSTSAGFDRRPAEPILAKCRGGGGEIAMVLQQGVDGERRVGLIGLERRGAAGEDVEDAILERGDSAGGLARPAPILVVAAFGERPAMPLEHGTDVAPLVVVVAGPASGVVAGRRWCRSLKRRRDWPARAHTGSEPRRLRAGAPVRLPLRTGRLGEVALQELVAGRRCAQEEPALATGLDQRQEDVPTAVGDPGVA